VSKDVNSVSASVFAGVRYDEMAVLRFGAKVLK